MSDDNREIAAAILASSLVDVRTPVPDTVRTYYEVLEALTAEGDRRLKAKRVPGFNRPLK